MIGKEANPDFLSDGVERRCLGAGGLGTEMVEERSANGDEDDDQRVPD